MEVANYQASSSGSVPTSCYGNMTTRNVNLMVVLQKESGYQDVSHCQ